ncbi:MAG: hypothetical protein L6R39_000423 [Caloplaca ligustica]|nr:MAG: hypothetical protein L6R39_000423 [Caloplaca ligustica]
MTSFPCLTGRRAGVAQEYDIHVASKSRLSFSDLQEAARHLNVSLVAIPQLAWAKILQVYTGSQDGVVFDCNLPWCGEENNVFRASSVVSVSATQIQGLSAVDGALSHFSGAGSQRDNPHESVLSQDGVEKEQKLDGSMLDLRYLVETTGCSTSGHGPVRPLKYGAAICLRVFRSTNGLLSLRVSSKSSLIDDAAALLLLAQYDYILDAILRHPDESVNNIFIHLPPTMLSISNPEPSVSASFFSLQSQFENTAESSPERVALEYWTSQHSNTLHAATIWTYAQLDQKATTFAVNLHSRFGSLSGHIIAVCMDRCPEIYVAILGILKAGAAWSPIDPSFPPLRRHDLITRTGAKALVVTNQSPRDGIPKDVVAIDLPRLNWSTSKQPKQAPINPDSLAYLIWTSGTTGTPKGVPISHQAATASMKALQKLIPTDVKQGNIRCLQFSQFTFDVFMQDLFYTWGVGGTLISADRATMLGSFSSLAKKAKATHAHLTPAFAASLPRESCPTLEVVTMIGEKLTPNVADDWSQDCRLYNTYGPAEATVVSTLRLVPHRDTLQSANIGWPLPTISAFVIQDGELVIRSGIGELALSGPQLSKGYWKDLQRSRERFVWNERLQITLYLTGDIVRQLENGSFEFIGRTDDLIKIQGIRVELSEIAFALRSCHSQVQQIEIAFLERPDRPSKVIVAFLAAPTSSADSRGIIEDEKGVEVARKALEAAKTQLPGYMIPTVFVVVSAIPRTPSAKVDRPALEQCYAQFDLEAWERKLASRATPGEAAVNMNSREVVIMGSIASVTGTSKKAMSKQSTLQSLGVDSIAATRLATALCAQGIVASLTEILECLTLDDLLQCPRKERSETIPGAFDVLAFHREAVGYLPPELANGVEMVMPILPLQESLISESFQDRMSYWSHNCFELDPGIDLESLKLAWETVAQSTEALRISFYPTAEISRVFNIRMTFLQLLLKEARVDWAVLPATERNIKTRARDRARELTERHQKKRFAEPPWAVTAFSLGSRTVMMFSVHHAIRDEPSVKIVTADLRHAYAGDGARPQIRYQLREAVRLLYVYETDRIERDEKFWANSLSGFKDEDSKQWPELKLADDGQREGNITYCWDAIDSYNNLRARATSIGAASLAAVLRVIWGTILLQYLETDKVVFGETWSARGKAMELSEVVGPLILVTPVPFRALGSWRETIQNVTDFQQGARAHYGVHPRSIRKILNRSKDDDLYPAILNFVPDSTEQQQCNDCSLLTRIEDIVGLSVEHAIAFNISISNDGTLVFELSALAQHMDKDHLQIVAQQIDALLKFALDDPDRPLTHFCDRMPRDLLSITPIERTSIPNNSWNQSPTQWVDHFAAHHPHWVAAEVVSSLSENAVAVQPWSYEQLQKAYQNVAALIGRNGYRNRMIAMCLDRRLEMYAVMLGIMSSGNTYLPIADDLPEERKRFLLQDSDAAMLFTAKSLSSTLSSVCSTVFVEDVDYKNLVNQSSLETNLQSQPTDNVYLLYTSGSTGTPKGVLVSRGNLVSFIEAISDFISSHVDMTSLQGKGKWLGMAGFAFDVHLLEMFFPWRHGMAAVTAPRPILIDNLELALQKLKITHASFVPSLVDNAGLDPSNLPDLRYMSLGGEKISKKAIDTWSRSHVLLANAYGPTEVTIGCCFRKVEPTNNVRNIGHPLPYTLAHVLRPGTTDHVLRGTSGELCLTGDLVANGYHKRPDAKGFVKDFHGTRLYRTGDLVRLMADGSLEFLGRDDDQTKVRGQRIELGEVSEAVRTAACKSLDVDLVEVASIVAQHQALARPQLVSFVATGGSSRNNLGVASTMLDFSTKDSVEEIRAHCRSILPSFMVPDHLIRLTSIPTTSTSRKVDLKRLRRIFDNVSLDDLLSSQPPTTFGVADPDEAEITVRSEVAEVLAVDPGRLCADSNLYRLGLDSLNVINLTIKLQRRGFECSVSKILRDPTIRAISRCKNRSVEEGKIPHAPCRIADLERRFREKNKGTINLANVAAVAPCLPLQETLVASSLDDPGEALYVNHVVFKISPDVDHRKLIQAWTAVAQDNAILRTCFREYENHFVQVVLKESRLAYHCHYLGASDAALSYLQRQRSAVAFDIVTNLESRPPIVLNLAAPHSKGPKAMLMVSVHHALYDADSFSILLDEVHVRYQGSTSSVRHTPVTALIDYIDSQSRLDAKSFWTGYLADHKTSPISIEAGNGQARSTNRQLDTSLMDIEMLATSLNGTPASLMQALFGIVLAETLQTDDVIFGAILSGRIVPVENAHSILAPCITTIPQRVRLDHASSLRNIIISAQKGFAESIEYQHTALGDIHRWVGAENPLFDTLFTYTRKRREASWSHLWYEVESSMASGFPLAVEVVANNRDNTITAICDYTAAFGTSQKADALLDRLQSLTRALVQGQEVILEKPVSEHRGKRLPASPVGNHWNQDEMLIRKLLSDMVDVDAKKISKDTTFFALGVDSIIAIQLAKRLRQHGIQCSSADIMRHPCIGKLSRHLKPGGPSAPVESNGLVERAQVLDVPRNGSNDEIVKTYPCTPLQSSMLTQTLGSDGSLYVHHHAIRFRDGDHTIGIRNAWEDLVAGTEILRTGFHFSAETKAWSGAVRRQTSICWTQHASGINFEAAMSHIKKWFTFCNEIDFKSPPWQADVVGNVLILSMHHSLYDGESIRLLFRDLWSLMKGSRLPKRPLFSLAAEQIHGTKSEAINFWIQSLSNTNKNPIESPSGGFREAKAGLDLKATTALELCKNLGITLQSAALLAFGKTLAWRSGQRDVVFGHIIRGRTLPPLEAEDVIGPLFNTVPIRVNLEHPNTTNQDVVHAIQHLTGESQAYQHAPLSRIQQVWREQIGNPDAQLFDSLFVFQKRATEEQDPSWESVAVDDDVAPTEYMMNFECEQTDNDIAICVNTRIVQDLDKLVQVFELILRDILETPCKPVTAVLDELPPPSPASSAVAKHVTESTPADGSKPNISMDTLRTVRALLAKVSAISVDKIADDASIFSLGLDSVSAIQIAASARKEGLTLSVADVLQGRTLKGICERLGERQSEAASEGDQTKAAASDLSAEPAEGPVSMQISQDVRSKALVLAGLRDEEAEKVLPCLPGQYYHFLTWLKSDRTLGEGTFAYRCDSSLDPDRLLRAWRGLRKRHPVLRTVFVPVSEKEALQIVLKATAIKSDAFQCIDYAPPTGVNATSEIVKYTASRRFDGFSPPVELCLAASHGGRHEISLKLHHALYDAWTIGKIIDDLSAFYEGRDLPPVPDTSSLIQDILRASTAQSAQNYWRKSLQSCHETILSQTPPTSPSSQPGRQGYFFTRNVTRDLRKLESKCQQSSTSLPTVILVAFARTLAKCTAVDSPTFGLYQTGRSSPIEGLAESCLPCLNMTPVMVREVLTRDTRASIESLQSNLADRVPCEQSNLHDIFEWIGWGQKPLFNTFVNILWGTETGSRLDGVDEKLLRPWSDDNMELLAPRSRLPGRTAVDGLDMSILANGNLFLDVQRCGSEDELRLVARCDYSVMDEVGARMFVEEITEEITRCLDSGLAGEREG